MAQPPAMSQLPALGGTGLVSQLYEYLWTKNNLLQTRCMYHKCPPVLIPDTILLKSKQPLSWYFSSLKTGSLQRRTKDLSVSKVTEALIRRQDPSTDIVAAFVGSAQGKKRNLSHLPISPPVLLLFPALVTFVLRVLNPGSCGFRLKSDSASRSQLAGDVQPITEYLTPAGLDYFLSTPPSRRTKTGMLQSFIHPKGTSNFVVRVSWSPDNCSMDSCININKLNDPELEVQDRASTNDDQNCVLIPMSGNVLATQLERLCSCIAEHLHLASQQLYKVTSMVITFKIDSEDRVWLLWCEQLEVGDDMGNPIRTSVSNPQQILGGEGDEEDEETKQRKTKNTKRGDVTFTPGKAKKSSTQSRYVEEEPEFVESEDEEAPRHGRGDEVDGSDEEPRFRPLTVDSEDMDPSDFVLLPKGEKERTKKSRSSKGKKVDSDTEEPSGSEPPSPKVDKKKSLKGRDGREKEKRAESASKDRELKMLMIEEKKKREEAERKTLEAEEKLRRAEAKARAAEAKLKKAQAAKEELIPTEKKQKDVKPADKSKKTTSLPKIAVPSPLSRPSSKGPQQDALVDIEDEKDIDPHSVAEMAEEVVKAADISAGGDDDEPEEDYSATADILKPGDDEKEPDAWDDELPSGKPKAAKFDLEAAEQGVRDPEEEEEAEFRGTARTVSAEQEVESEDQATQNDEHDSQVKDSAAVQSEASNSRSEPGVSLLAELDTERPVEEDKKQAKNDYDSAGEEYVDERSAVSVHVAPLEGRHEASTKPMPPQAEATAAPKRAAEGDQEKDDAYDPEEYDDKPIENIPSIQAKAPKARPIESVPAAAAEVVTVASSTAAQPPGSHFSVEASGGEQEAGGAMPPKEKRAMVAVSADSELKCAKNLVNVEPSPMLTSKLQVDLLRTVGSGPTARPVERNAKGDELDRDLRMVYQSGAHQFASEFRVGTSTAKWQSKGMDTVMDGERVSTNISTFSEGGEAFSCSSMFDDDGLQPPHLQALLQGRVVTSKMAEDESQRCDHFWDMSKAVPDPIPDFHKPIDSAQLTVEKDGTTLGLALPLRKVKGKADKTRELRVEVICTPIIKSQDGGAEEDPLRLKMELGLPEVLWKYDEQKGSKEMAGGNEIPREESEFRFLQYNDRLKGQEQGQIETASVSEVGKADVGFANEVVKKPGDNAKTLEGDKRDVNSENIVKNSEWAFDEYLRPETQSIAAFSKKLEAEEEPSEVMEVKFDVQFSTDEERMVFAKAQRDKLAKMLGVPPEYIEIAGVKPGSPITMIRFNIKRTDAAMIPDPGPGSADDSSANPFDKQAISISMTETAGEDAHRQLGQRLKAAGALASIPIEDRAVQSTLNRTVPPELLDSMKAYSRENQPQPRQDSRSRAKGECDDSIPGSRFEDANQLTIVSGEFESTSTNTKKDKGKIASLDEDGVDRIYKPGREMMTDDQFSSAKVQRRPPKPAKRMLEIPLAHDGEVEEQVKVPYEEVDNCRRLKEQEDELNFLPAQRAAMGPRTAIMAKKDEGLEDHRFDRLDEHDSRMEEKVKEEASKQPSLKLTKAVEETEYELAQKITGLEDPRTTVPCEPAGLSTGDRRQKKKGKNGEKLHKAAIPEHYMAFGTEGESQRLAPSVVTLEKPGVKGVEDDGKAVSGKGLPDLIDKTAPDVLSMKFDVSFVDEKSRAQFAEAQRQKLAQLLKIPVDAISVRAAVPGSPITVVTFEIDPGVVTRAIDDAQLMHTSRPFDNPVLDIEVTAAMDESADAIMKRMKVIVGPKVPISRQSIVPGKAGAALKDKNVKFGGDENQPTPAYMRGREELELQGKRQGGALMADKEAAEVSNDSNAAAKAAELKKSMMAESGMDDKKPVLSYDRRLPKNAKNKQHLLSRIHTIESTLQRLYGKLEADNEYPSVESIEQIMSSTIKQAVFTGDETQDIAQTAPKAGKKAGKKPTQDKDLEEEEEEEAGHDLGAEGDDGPVDEDDRRANIRAERRRRMEERERTRAEKASLEVKKPGAPAVAGGVRFGETEEKTVPVSNINRLKQMQLEDDDDLRLQPSNIPAYGDQDDDVAAQKKKNALKGFGKKGFDQSMGATGRGNDDDGDSPRTKTGRSDGGGMSAAELQQMASSDDQNAWKSAFSKVRHGKKNDLVSMLDAGCPTDLKDSTGNTLLNVAAQNGQKSIIKALMRRGAALNTQNHNGQTPLHFCFTYGYEDLGKYLISKGADDTVQNFAGLTCYEGLGE